MKQKLDVINQALGLFSGEKLGSLDEDSITARYALQAFDTAYQSLINRRHWSFLCKDIVLRETLGTSDNHKYTHQYLLPDGVDKILAVSSDYIDFVYFWPETTPHVYRLYEQRGLYLYSNFNPAFVYYLTNDTEDVTFSHGFRLALVRLMAVDLAISKKESVILSNHYMKMAEMDIRHAISDDVYLKKTMVPKVMDPFSGSLRNKTKEY